MAKNALEYPGMRDHKAVPPRNLPDAGYAALVEGAALVDLFHKTIVRLGGEGAVGMLNATLTNEVPGAVNGGVYALLLNPKGRIQADLRVLKNEGEVLIDTEPEGSAKELLGRYAPFYHVEVEDLTEADAAWGILGLYGPRAEELLDGPELAEHETARVRVGSADLLAAGVAVPVTGYDLIGPADILGAARDYLAGRGAVQASPRAYETARIKAGIPRFGSDITPENFPAEAEYILERAVSFEKGCYPGQETVARMRYRGHPNKVLHRFVLKGAPPPPDTAILQDGKHVGKLTSLAPLPVDGALFALGYLSRNADSMVPLSAGNATLLPLA